MNLPFASLKSEEDDRPLAEQTERKNRLNAIVFVGSKGESSLIISRTFNHIMQRESAVALGFFDGIHLGHRAVIDSALAEQKNGLLTCVFTFTTNIAVPEGKMNTGLLQTEEQKCHILAELGVDYMTAPDFSLFKNMLPEDFATDIVVKSFGARVVACGYDFRFGRGGSAGAEDLTRFLKPFGILVKIVPAVLDESGLAVSSTRIRQAVSEGNIPLANRLMGRPFSIDFPVTHGRKLGRRLDFPTINQRFPQGFQIPRFGVYASRVTVGGQTFAGATNVGIKPTVGGEKDPLAETYIIGFDGDLYGCPVLVEFLDFIRPEQKFIDIDELKAAIAEDARQAKMFCAR